MNGENENVPQVQPEKMTTLVDWGWAYVPDVTGAGVLVLQSPTGLERISFPMSLNTVRNLRRELMGVITP